MLHLSDLNWRYYTYGCSKNVILNASLSNTGIKKMLLETKAIKLTTGDTPNNGFYSGTVELGSFSEPFESIPKVIATMASANGTTLLIGIVSTSKTSWGRAVIVSNAKRTDFPCSINLISIQI